MATPPLRRFRHGLRARTAPAGATLLEALARTGLPRVVRSVRYHRARGPFCGTGDCAGCLVRVNGRPNVRACLHPVADGDRVDAGNGWPSARFDLAGAIDLVFPRGIDTLRGFRRPAWARAVYQRVIRRLAGFGEPPEPGAAEALRLPPRRYDTELLIVGAGDAGRAAAAQAVRRGARPLVVDRRPVIEPIAGADCLPATSGTFLPPPETEAARPFRLLGFEAPGRGVTVRAGSVIVATGAYDAALLFGGNDRPGVVSAELAVGWARELDRSPLRRAVVVGGGGRAAEVLDALGDAVRAVVAPGEIGPEVARRAAAHAVRLYPRSLVVRTHGRARVRSLEIRTRGGGPRSMLPCDSVVLAHRRVPQGQLLHQAGAALEWAVDVETWRARCAPSSATTVPRLFAAGSVVGFHGADSAPSGVRAADAAADRAPPFTDPPVPAPRAPGALESYYRELWKQPRSGKWIACPCEDVILDEVEAAVARGYRGVEVVKRYTGLGTGLCQGRYCLPDGALVLAVLERRAPADVGSITPRPPAIPTPLAALAAVAEEYPGEVVP